MSKFTKFRSAHSEIMRDATEAVAAIRAKCDEALELLAVEAFGAPRAEDNSLMSPPDEPIKVSCSHCGRRYMSNELRLEYRPRLQPIMVEMMESEGSLGALWWCKTDGCDGAGFGHDIHPVRERKPRAAA